MVADAQAEDAGTMRQRFEGQVILLTMMWGTAGAACTHALWLVNEYVVQRAGVVRDPLWFVVTVATVAFAGAAAVSWYTVYLFLRRWVGVVSASGHPAK